MNQGQKRALQRTRKRQKGEPVPEDALDSNPKPTKPKPTTDEKRLRISDDIQVKTEGTSAFTIYMKADEGEQIVELLGSELSLIIPLMKRYLKELSAEPIQE